MQIGLVGLQFSGKTTLFNTLAGIKSHDLHSMKEEASIEVVKVPDERVDNLNRIFNSKKVYAKIEIFDTPGLRMSEDGRVKITNSFLNNVRYNDALCYVVRQFKDETVPHPLKSIEPSRDIRFLETEFLLSDLAFLENRIEKLKKEIMKTKEENIKRELPLLEKCLSHAETDKPLRNLPLLNDEKKILSGYQLLTLKPLMIALNCDENSINKIDETTSNLIDDLNGNGISLIPFFAQIEYELSNLDEAEQDAFMTEYGIKESALSKILRISYGMLGLHSFFTVGKDECRAWTIKEGFNAQQAAGVVHTDFFNRFIRAEVVHYNDFIKYESFAKCKDAGVWRLEGKEYIVRDGDILTIRHN